MIDTGQGLASMGSVVKRLPILDVVVGCSPLFVEEKRLEVAYT